MNKDILLKIGFFSILITALVGSALGETLDQIEGMIQAGRYAEAKSSLQTGLREHPESARGWYYLAQDDYFLKDYRGAQQALDRSKTIDPSLGFTNHPEKVSSLESILKEHLANPMATGYYPSQNNGKATGGFAFLPILLLIGGGLFVLMLVVRFFRANAYNPNPMPYPPGSAPGVPGAGYPPPYPPAYPPMGGGLGSIVGGMAAGAVLDELIRPREEVIREREVVQDDRPVNDPPAPDGFTFDPGNGDSSDAGSFDSGGSSSDNSGW